MKKIFIIVPIFIVLCVGIFIFLNARSNKKYNLEYDFVLLTHENYDLYKDNKEYNYQDNYLDNIKDLLDEYDVKQKEEDKLNNREVRNTKYIVTKNDNDNINYEVIFECNDLDKDNCHNLYKSYIMYVLTELELRYGLVSNSLVNNYKFIEK